MLSLQIHFLTDRYAATSYNDRRRAEWPPHPSRVYSALVAALHDDPDHPPEQRRALEWLSEAGPPVIVASEASFRQLSDVYVPTNDETPLKSIDAALTELEAAIADLERAQDSKRPKAERRLEKARDKLLEQSGKTADEAPKGKPPRNFAALSPPRHPRTFPVAIPEDGSVLMQWSRSPTAALTEALDQVAARVSRLGHSSSLVSMKVAPEAPEAGERHIWKPDPDGPETLRVVTAGQLARLESAHQRHRQVEPRKLPTSFERYRRGRRGRRSTGGAVSVFAADRWLLFEMVAGGNEDRRRLLDAALSAKITRALRGLLLSAVDGNWPEVLSGHRADGRPSEIPHLAFLALPDVGHRHASGSILGTALVAPNALNAEDRGHLLHAVALAEERAAREQGVLEFGTAGLRLTLGRSGTLYLRRVQDLHPTRTLQAGRWTRASRRWVSATAVALGRNPGNLLARDPEVAASAVRRAEALVAGDCAHIGLPPPAAVWVHPRSLLEGAPEARRFMPFPARGAGPQRICVHAELLFDEPVRGPVILGAGRYFGLGLCAPAD